MKSYTINYMIIAPEKKCNFMCGHCGFESSPEKTGSMPFNQARYYVRQIPEVECNILQISGPGETFLYKDLDRLIEEAGRVKAKTGYPKKISLYTNGSWAIDLEETTKRLMELKENGLNELVVSNSQYHQEFSDPKTIKILEKVGKNKGAPKIYVGNGSITELAPVGRGKNHPGMWQDVMPSCGLTEMVFQDIDKNLGDRTVSVSFDGLYQCCWNRWKIGELGESLQTVVERAMKDPLNHLLGDHGVGNTIRDMKAMGYMKGLNPDANECLLCEEILNNSKLMSELRENSKTMLKKVIRMNKKEILGDMAVWGEERDNYKKFFDFQESLTV